MELHRDFKELLESFNAHGVEYVLVGAYALAFHRAPRYTGDLDLFVRPVPDSSIRTIHLRASTVSHAPWRAGCNVWRAISSACRRRR